MLVHRTTFHTWEKRGILVHKMSFHSWELSLSGSNLQSRQTESRWWQGVKHKTQGKVKYAEKNMLFLQVYEGL